LYEGTSLDVVATIIGLAMSALMNIAMAYYVLLRLRRGTIDANRTREK
jgi:hypothetical protein